jgi:hypothetical protein
VRSRADERMRLESKRQARQGAKALRLQDKLRDR